MKKLLKIPFIALLISSMFIISAYGTSYSEGETVNTAVSTTETPVEDYDDDEEC